MLSEIFFNNFKSIKDQICIDLETKDGRAINIVTAIYGDNGSGKSNILESILFMKNFVLNSFKEEAKWNQIPLNKFQFDVDSKNSTSSFTITFQYKNNLYLYGFRLDENSIKEEILFKYTKVENETKFIFHKINENILLSKELEIYREMLNGLSNKTLILSFLANLKIEDIKIVYNYLKNIEVLHLKNISYKEMLSELLIKELSEDNLKTDKILKIFLKEMELNIEGIKIEKLISFGGIKYNIFTVYKNNQTGKKEYIPLSEESDGIIKMIYIFLKIQNCLNTGGAIFIDDLDAHLSSKFIGYVIKKFQHKSTNPNISQLIFTSNTLIRLSNFQSFIVEKDENNESHVYDYQSQDED